MLGLARGRGRCCRGEIVEGSGHLDRGPVGVRQADVDGDAAVVVGAGLGIGHVAGVGDLFPHGPLYLEGPVAIPQHQLQPLRLELGDQSFQFGRQVGMQVAAVELELGVDVLLQEIVFGGVFQGKQEGGALQRHKERGLGVRGVGNPSE